MQAENHIFIVVRAFLALEEAHSEIGARASHPPEGQNDTD